MPNFSQSRLILTRSIYRSLFCQRQCSTHVCTASNVNAVELTEIRYPNVKRHNFSVITDADLKFFEKLLPSRIVTNELELEAFNVDWLKTCRGQGKLLLKPQSTDEVSKILQYCNNRRLAVMPQGGNTSLSGGSVPVFDEIIISTSLMNKIGAFDEVSGVLECQAGCILENLETFVNEHDLCMPLDLGAKGSCHIGGNVATNAGGLRVLRYGSLHGNVLGLEAVLPNGTVLDCMSSLRKDNTGYDLKQLLIGSEGTLAFITAVSILCAPKPVNTQLAFLGCENFENVKKVYQQSKNFLGEILSAVEFLDRKCMKRTVANLNLKNPLSDCPFYALIETSGSNSKHDEDKLTLFLEAMMNDGVVMDGTLATDETKVKNIWMLRERMAEAMLKEGYNFKYDISVPLSHFYDIVTLLRDRLGDKVYNVVGYGHIGDSNLHINVTCPTYSEEVHDLLEPFIYDWVSSHRGSVSAEHGLGFKKTDYIYHSNTKTAVNIMKEMKKLFDPNGILNPYKLFPVI